MATISEKIAQVLIKNNGFYPNEPGDTLPPDPQCFAVFKIKNKYFGHEHHCVAYTKEDFEAYIKDGHKVTELLWCQDPKVNWTPEGIGFSGADIGV